MQIWQISAHKSNLNYVGKIVRQIFWQALCAGDFSPGKQIVVESTPGPNLIKALGAYLGA